MIIMAFNQQPGEWHRYEYGIPKKKKKKHELEYKIPYGWRQD